MNSVKNGGILGAAGRPIVAFGGSYAWKQYRKGDLVISFQWLKLHDFDEMPEPCMCLFRANSSKLVQRQSNGAYVIPQNRACDYVHSKTGQPLPALLMGAVSAAKHMGYFPDQSTCFRIADAIVESIPDLILMPDVPSFDLEKHLFEPPKEGIEVTIREGSTVIAQGEA